MNEVAQTTDVAQRARRRIFRRTMPFLFVLFVIAFLDRVNVSYAKLTMIDELGFTQKIYGFGAGIFFIGYFLLEIPGSLIAERWSARKWIARIMVSWGLLSILTGFIHSPTQFYWARFLLGAAEAGFFPGIIVYLTHWFVYEDRAKAVGRFMAAIPISFVIGSPLAGALGWSKILTAMAIPIWASVNITATRRRCGISTALLSSEGRMAQTSLLAGRESARRILMAMVILTCCCGIQQLARQLFGT